MTQNLCACLGELVEKICSGDAKSLEAAADSVVLTAPAPAPPAPPAPAPERALPVEAPAATLAVPNVPLETEKSEVISEGKASESRSRVSAESRASTKKRRQPAQPLRSPRALPPAVLKEDPASRAFFCGHWPGKRNDYEGEAGFKILPEMDFEITALGRCAEPPLMEAALVSVWETKSQECLASALVGPTSRVDGFYAWEPLMEPVVLKKGQEYRLSQRCRANMLDRWCDDYATKEELSGKSWAALASFIGGVCREKSDCEFSSFPHLSDGALRRAGIVNFKAILRPGPEPELRRVDREAFARDLALQLTATSSEAAPLPVEEVELRLAALAGLLALLVDELQGVSALALLAPQEELEIIVASAAAVNPWGQVELAGASVFDSRALCQEMGLAARRSGQLDAGLLLVAFTGEVMGLVLRPRCAGGALAAAGGPMVFDQGRPLQPWEIAQQLPGPGLAMAKQLAGDVLAYDARQMQRGNAGGPDQVRSFQFRMIELQELFTDPESDHGSCWEYWGPSANHSKSKAMQTSQLLKDHFPA
eukprot:s32_g10.t1